MCDDRSKIAAKDGGENEFTVLPLDSCLQNEASFREDRDNESLNSHSGTERDTKGEKIVIYTNKAATLQNGGTASKQDVTLHIDKSSTKEINLDHGEKWPTSFWTQFRVLSHRTFKQSLPVILSKLNLIQVCATSLHVIGVLSFNLVGRWRHLDSK